MTDVKLPPIPPEPEGYVPYAEGGQTNADAYFDGYTACLATVKRLNNQPSITASAELAALEAIMESIDPATWPGLSTEHRCALGRFAKPSRWEPTAKLPESAASEDEPYVDEDGNTWTRPTAWAYSMLCKAYDRVCKEQRPIRDMLNRARIYLYGYTDEGPIGQGWKSAKLQAFVDRISEVTSGAATASDDDDKITANVGRWLSAALSDPTTCQEMKDDILAWMEAGQPNVQPAASSEPRRVGEIRIDSKHHPYAVLETAYDDHGCGWKHKTPIYAAPVAAQAQLPVSGDDEFPAVKALEGETHVAVPIGILAACKYAIEKKKDAPNLLAELRRYAIGDLSMPIDRPSAQDREDVLTQAARDVLAERRRQVEVEGWTPEHDDKHCNRSLAMAAACYCEPRYRFHNEAPTAWPWDKTWWKPTTPRRDLVKAAALILAEIERIDRAANKE